MGVRGLFDRDDMDHQLVAWRKERDIEPLSAFGYFACASYMLILGVFAIGGNSLTLYMFAKNAESRVKPMNMLIINIAISDLLVGVFGYPFEMWSFVKQYFTYGHTFCLFQGASLFLFALVDMTSLIAFSIYRYLIVCRPETGALLDYKMTLKVCAAIWAYALMWVSMPLMGINSYEVEDFGTTCTIDWNSRESSGRAYIYFLMLCCFFIPVGTMIYCYVMVLKESEKQQAKTTVIKTSTADLGVASEANIVLAEAKVSRISVIMVATYLMSWAPFAIISFICMNFDHVPVEIKVIPHMASKISCAVNPVIFFFTNQVFKDTFMATFIRRTKISPGIADKQTFTIDKSKEGVFLGEQEVTFKKAPTSMF